MKPGFSVVIPTRNRPHFLPKAIDSVLAQSLPAVELIIVDDGVGAGAALNGRTESVKVLDNQERGPVPARNLGVATAQGQWIAFLDDDDWWTDPNYLSRAAALFDQGADLCFGDGTMIFSDGHPDLRYAFSADRRSLEQDNTILISAVSYRRSLHDRLGDFDEGLPYYWDWDWYLRVARSGAQLRHINSPVTAIRIHGQNMSGDSLEDERRSNLDAFARKHGLPPLRLKNHLSLLRERPSPP
ncbi:MAG: glycosyltransferase [Alphaproteobacteria bacterium]|nr:glycosyltransferase [Alphaproteobacteria bacterium]